MLVLFCAVQRDDIRHVTPPHPVRSQHVSIDACYVDFFAPPLGIGAGELPALAPPAAPAGGPRNDEKAPEEGIDSDSDCDLQPGGGRARAPLLAAPAVPAASDLSRQIG
eukprot:s866_g11.t1